MTSYVRGEYEQGTRNQGSSLSEREEKKSTKRLGIMSKTVKEMAGKTMYEKKTVFEQREAMGTKAENRNLSPSSRERKKG